MHQKGLKQAADITAWQAAALQLKYFQPHLHEKLFLILNQKFNFYKNYEIFQTTCDKVHVT